MAKKIWLMLVHRIEILQIFFLPNPREIFLFGKKKGF